MDAALVWSGVTLVAVLGGALWTWFCVRNPGAATSVVVAAAVVSAHILAMLYSAGVNAAVVRNLIPLKDAAAVLLAVVLLVREVRSDRSVKWLGMPVILLAVVWFPALVHGLASHPVSDVLLSARNALLPILAAATGLLLHGRDRRRAIVGTVAVISVAAAYALVEYLLPVSFLIDVVGVGNYYVDVKEQPFLLSPSGTGLPGNFFTSSGSRRLSGSFGDPLAAGYALSAGVLLAVTRRHGASRLVAFAVMTGALILTFTRAGMLIALSALLQVTVWTYRSMSLWRRLWSVLAVVFGLLASLWLTPVGDYVDTVLSGDDSSTRAHLGALRLLDDHEYTVMGDGFGAAGAAVDRGTENVLVTVALQVGVAGLVLYLIALVSLARRGSKRWRSAGLRWVYLGTLAALAVTMVISEQMLTFNAGYVVVLAVFLGPWAPVPAIAVTDQSSDDSAPANGSEGRRPAGRTNTS